MPGAESPRVHCLRNFADALALRESLRPNMHIAVIGGGFIGLEVASAARRCGATVTVLELAPQLLARVAAFEIAEWMERLHRRNGVEVRTATAVTALIDDGRQVRLHTSDGRGIIADAVVVGIGAVPNVELARDAGLLVEDGIVVDEYGRTSDRHIWAAGDVSRHYNPILGRSLRLESWENAEHQSACVARCMAGRMSPYARLPWFWSDQHGVNFQMIGMPEGYNSIVWRGRQENGPCTVFYLNDGLPVAAVTMNNGRDIRPAAQLIRDGRTVDPALLGDPTVKLQALVAKEAPTMSP